MSTPHYESCHKMSHDKAWVLLTKRFASRCEIRRKHGRVCCASVCAYVRGCLRLCVSAFTCVYACACVRVCVWERVCVRVCVRESVCVYTHHPTLQSRHELGQNFPAQKSLGSFPYNESAVGLFKIATGWALHIDAYMWMYKIYMYMICTYIYEYICMYTYIYTYMIKVCIHICLLTYYYIVEDKSRYTYILWHILIEVCIHIICIDYILYCRGQK